VGALVLGMHRSGTSAVTAALHQLGLGVPEGEDLLTGALDNPEGHWESLSLTRFNNGLLAGLGGAWFAPPAIGEGWEQHPRLEPELRRAAALFPTVFPSDPWVWKDPRNCILAPFWYRVIGDEHAIVLVFRNPLEVAESLQRRNGIDRRRALALWERYTDDALRHALGRPVLVTGYERALATGRDWTEQARDFLADHGLAGDTATGPAAPGLKPELRHAVREPGDLVSDPDVTPRQRQLFETLLQLEGAHDRFLQR
jgi:hypothetical protein